MSHATDSIAVTASPRPRTRALALACLLALASPWAMAQGNDTPGFGLNYWLRSYKGCEALTDANWPAARQAVAADLDLMKSLGADVLRLSLYMETSGYPAGVGSSIDPDYCKHLPDLLSTIENAGFKTVIVFSNTYLLRHQAGTYDNWQDPSLGYHAQSNGYWQFVMHSKAWIDRMVGLAGDRDSILYYDIQNEYDADRANIDYYFRTIYSESAIPAGKRGISILDVPADISSANWHSIPKQLEVLGGTLSHVEFHSYPTVPKAGCPLHGDIESVYDQMRAAFPASTKIVLGEFGRATTQAFDPAPDAGPYLPQCNTSEQPDRRWDEPRQRQTELDLIGRAAAKGIPYYLHWMLWDNTPKSDDFNPANPNHQVYGYGYGPHAPKDVIGALAERRGRVPNADFEQLAQIGQLPQRWDKGSWGPANSAPPVSLFVSGGPNSGEAATGDHYARLQAQQACAACVIWMQADAFDIGPGRRVHMNAYLRSNLAGVQMKLVQYDAQWNVLATSVAPAMTASGWSWNNYAVRFREQNPASASASWSVTTVPGAARAIVTIGGTPITAPAILDVDAVSVAAD
ncbi:hypothetical protein AZ78_2609 [Lysobacter capsici AZ78]|uniref:Glycoside hydrolase family 5 domain-containing protein n=1 Tax=Lysobacter capsici AZ78 TaxID=1444315 RepID=A0A108U9J9_9GAMM|nr:hypothetical protein [Lysobacter capsici]KWS05059.1 hypothetical protein AZ78_2609 [Lysobacter capsici AZ78]